MARPERNNIDYFPHEVNNGKKMHYIESKYKNDGYAVWFKLLEQLGSADHHFLAISDPVQLMYLSSEFNVSEDILKSIIEDLVKMEVFDKELYSLGILYNQKFVDSIQDAYTKRRNVCIDRNSLLILLQDKGLLKQSKSTRKQSKSTLQVSVNPQRIEEDRIEDKRIGNNTKGNYPILFRDSIFFDLEKLKSGLLESKPPYSEANAEYYHNAMQNWSDQGAKKKIDWLATCRVWILKDFKDGKLITHDYKPGQNGTGNSKISPMAAYKAELTGNG